MRVHKESIAEDYSSPDVMSYQPHTHTHTSCMHWEVNGGQKLRIVSLLILSSGEHR